MFEALSDKLQKVLRDLKGEGRVSESHLDLSMREIRIALLEADVHFKIVKSFVATVREKALGQAVMESLTPGQQIVKIVRDELTQLLGGQSVPLDLGKKPPSVVLLVGLQGSGKTTTCGKLGLYLSNSGKHPLLVPADVSRPAAIQQLTVIGEAVGLAVFPSSPDLDPVDLAKQAIRQASNKGHDVVLVDTAGRLHIDDELMAELRAICQAVDPMEILFVADAMTGQDAVNSAKRFNENLNLSGIVLTKLDGDARGGAALSIRSITKTPIKFIGTGEKYEELDVFHPDRLASRILGMGDVLSLIEKAEEAVDQADAERMLEKLKKDEFTLEDFRKQLRQLRKLGPLDQILEMMPQFQGLKGLPSQVDERQLDHTEAIISSMTLKEKLNYRIIDGARRKRIALGSGRTVAEVNRLLKQYGQARKMMRQMSKGFFSKRLSKLGFPR